jgi:hypothetical protein
MTKSKHKEEKKCLLVPYSKATMLIEEIIPTPDIKNGIHVRLIDGSTRVIQVFPEVETEK